MSIARRLALVVPVTLVGVAVLVGGRILWPRNTPHPLHDLVNAVGTDLPYDVRLSGGFKPPASRSVLRSGSENRPTVLSPDTRIALAQLEKRAGADSTSETLAALGVAYLVQGEVDRAISTLSEAGAEGNNPAPWSDLAAAYLIKAQRQPQREIEYLARGLEAAAHSIRLAPSSEARFNRALAVEGLAPFVGETKPWADYLGAENDPEWIAIANERAAAVRLSDDARARWEGRRRELVQALDRHDSERVVGIVREFPEASIEYFEQEVLVAWARSKIAGQESAAASQSQRARLLGESIAAVTSDRMFLDSSNELRQGSVERARAHLAYAEGVLQYDRNDYDGASRSFDEALKDFRFEKSPYRDWATVQIATILFQRRNLAEADKLLEGVENGSRVAGYQTLRARTLWLQGLVFSKQWRLTEALAAFRSAATCYEQSHQQEHATSLYHHLADTLRSLGEYHESWENIGKTLHGLHQVRKPVRRYLSLYNAMLFAAAQGLDEPALLFQNAAIAESSNVSAFAEAEALTQRAAILLRRHESAKARTDVERAVIHLNQIPTGPLRLYAQAEIDVLTSRLGDPSPDQVQRLTRAIQYFAKTEPARLPGLYLELGRLHLTRHDLVAAEDTLSSGIVHLERQHAGLNDEALKVSYFDDSWALFQEMFQFQLSNRNNLDRAFEYAERSRARSLLASGSAPGRAVRLADVQAVLPTTAVLVYYVTLPERVVIWMVNSKNVKLVERRLSDRALGSQVERLRVALAEGRDSTEASRSLFENLLTPIDDWLPPGAMIVVVPDGRLHQIPFGALMDPDTGRYVLEDHAVIVTPSASFYVDTATRLTSILRSPSRAALLVGNPASTNAASLPGSEAEVLRAARHYPEHTVLTGSNATKSRFIMAAPENDVVHFGGHAYANAEYPLLSRLSFAGRGASQSDALFAYEISRLRFRRTKLVVLAACSTAVGAVSRGEGVMSVARPFLSAGVPTVIATQWDVDDRVTSHLISKFYELLSVNADPVKSLQLAQLSLLRSQDTLFSSAASWAAFSVMGASAH
jgi:CHAT domain-containing protein